MRLWRLLPPVEARLRTRGYELEAFDWCAENEPPLSQQQQPKQGDDTSRDRPLPPSGSERDAASAVAERISGCDIYWSRRAGDGHAGEAEDESGGISLTGKGGAAEGSGSATEEPRSDGAAATTANSKAAAPAAATTSPPTPTPDGTSFVGLMGQDDAGTWVQSQNVDGLEILVKDDLRLWADQLWVNDRGFDREGNFVYGNQRNVPYKMQRVVGGGPLEWTLGERYRTKETYAEKMAAIGVMPGQRLGPPARRAAAAPVSAGG